MIMPCLCPLLKVPESVTAPDTQISLIVEVENQCLSVHTLMTFDFVIWLTGIACSTRMLCDIHILWHRQTHFQSDVKMHIGHSQLDAKAYPMGKVCHSADV